MGQFVMAVPNNRNECRKVRLCVGLRVGCPSCCQEIPGDDQGASDEDLGDGIVDVRGHVEEED